MNLTTENRPNISELVRNYLRASPTLSTDEIIRLIQAEHGFSPNSVTVAVTRSKELRKLENRPVIHRTKPNRDVNVASIARDFFQNHPELTNAQIKHNIENQLGRKLGYSVISNARCKWNRSHSNGSSNGLAAITNSVSSLQSNTQSSVVRITIDAVRKLKEAVSAVGGVETAKELVELFS